MGNSFFVMCGCIDQASIGVVEKWGRFDKLASPGFHFFNPLAGEWLAGVLSTRISSLEVRIETKTKGQGACNFFQWEDETKLAPQSTSTVQESPEMVEKSVKRGAYGQKPKAEKD